MLYHEGKWLSPDELNHSRLCFIDQQERKLSCHLHGHGIHQKIKWRTCRISCPIVNYHIFTKSRRICEGILWLQTPFYSLRIQEEQTKRTGVGGERLLYILCLQIYLRINVSRHPTLLKPVCGKHCTWSHIYSSTRPQNNDFITVS